MTEDQLRAQLVMATLEEMQLRGWLRGRTAEATEKWEALVDADQRTGVIRTAVLVRWPVRPGWEWSGETTTSLTAALRFRLGNSILPLGFGISGSLVVPAPDDAGHVALVSAWHLSEDRAVFDLAMELRRR